MINVVLSQVAKDFHPSTVVHGIPTAGSLCWRSQDKKCEFSCILRLVWFPARGSRIDVSEELFRTAWVGPNRGQGPG